MVVEGGSTGSRAAKKRKLATHSAPRRAVLLDQTDIKDVESLEGRPAHGLRVIVGGGEEECVSVPLEGGGVRRNQHSDPSLTFVDAMTPSVHPLQGQKAFEVPCLYMYGNRSSGCLPQCSLRGRIAAHRDHFKRWKLAKQNRLASAPIRISVPAKCTHS